MAQVCVAVFVHGTTALQTAGRPLEQEDRATPCAIRRMVGGRANLDLPVSDPGLVFADRSPGLDVALVPVDAA